MNACLKISCLFGMIGLLPVAQAEQQRFWYPTGFIISNANSRNYSCAMPAEYPEECANARQYALDAGNDRAEQLRRRGCVVSDARGLRLPEVVGGRHNNRSKIPSSNCAMLNLAVLPQEQNRLSVERRRSLAAQVMWGSLLGSGVCQFALVSEPSVDNIARKGDYPAIDFIRIESANQRCHIIEESARCPEGSQKKRVEVRGNINGANGIVLNGVDYTTPWPMYYCEQDH